jgi:hypothetical protein
VGEWHLVSEDDEFAVYNEGTKNENEAFKPKIRKTASDAMTAISAAQGKAFKGMKVVGIRWAPSTTVEVVVARKGDAVHKVLREEEE